MSRKRGAGGLCTYRSQSSRALRGRKMNTTPAHQRLNRMERKHHTHTSPEIIYMSATHTLHPPLLKEN